LCLCSLFSETNDSSHGLERNFFERVRIIVKNYFDNSGGNQMKKFATFSTAALLAVSLSGAAFAQAGANPSAPQPSSTGQGVVQPGMDKNGTATDAKMKSGTTGMNDKSGMGSKDSKDGMKKDGMTK
jgi:hypothetical protein